MKVYLAIRDDGTEGDEVLGVFSTREKAWAHIRDACASGGYEVDMLGPSNEDWKVEVREVDALAGATWGESYMAQIEVDSGRVWNVRRILHWIRADGRPDFIGPYFSGRLENRARFLTAFHPHSGDAALAAAMARRHEILAEEGRVTGGR